MEDVEFFAAERGEFVAGEGCADEHAPTGGGEVPRCHEGVTGVVAFAGVDEKQAGTREKLGDEAGEFRADAFHQHVGGNATGERLLFEALHLLAA